MPATILKFVSFTGFTVTALALGIPACMLEDGRPDIIAVSQQEPGAQNGQEWVSACLMARSNSLGKKVAIEMVASHPAIGVTRTQPGTFVHEEAGFYGNLFLDPPVAGPDSCSGKSSDSYLDCMDEVGTSYPTITTYTAGL